MPPASRNRAATKAPPVAPATLARAAGEDGARRAALLLAWYDRHHRALPWRAETPAERDAYRTWLSEIMLQQTRVETVKPYYAAFLDRFPTVDDLADADLDRVLELWSGLGYYSRARNLHHAARQVRDAGGFPGDLAGLRGLKGVGPYVAGAIASIALGLDAAAVDGNVVRVLSRLWAHGEAGLHPGHKGVWALAEAMLPPGRAGDFNQALMDLGSGICTPRAPRCGACPLAADCDARAGDRVDAFPPVKVRRVAPARTGVAVVLERRGRVLLARRPEEGLFGGLYELPGGLLEEGEAVEPGAQRLVEERLGLPIRVEARLGEVQHTLTHMRLTLHVLRVATGAPVAGEVDAPVPDLDHRWYTASTWIRADDPGALGLSTLARKALAVATAPAAQQRLFGR
ncbi:MAG: A/G-specific adenine glycosylase [Alphaproteobacteria bacterium]|nr:A/G-specific adenine glycosylase [Alphaproteobacteria bacterium]